MIYILSRQHDQVDVLFLFRPDEMSWWQLKLRLFLHLLSGRWCFLWEQIVLQWELIWSDLCTTPRRNLLTLVVVKQTCETVQFVAQQRLWVTLVTRDWRLMELVGFYLQVQCTQMTKENVFTIHFSRINQIKTVFAQILKSTHLLPPVLQSQVKLHIKQTHVS